MRPAVLAGLTMGSGRLVSAAFRVSDARPEKREETAVFEGVRVGLTMLAGVLAGILFRKNKLAELAGAVGLLGLSEWMARIIFYASGNRGVDSALCNMLGGENPGLSGQRIPKTGYH